MATSRCGDHPSRTRTRTSFTLDLDAGVEKSRTNTRRFRIVEQLKDVYEADCSKAATWENWVYPITGATGMGEVVRTYVKLEKLSDVKTSGDPAFADVTKTFPGVTNIVFADVLNFTTTLTGGAKGTLVLNAVAGRLKVTNAVLGGTAMRRDAHNVIVALASDPKVDVDRDAQGRPFVRPARTSAKMAIARVERKQLIEAEVLPDPRTVTALIQKDATARNRVLIELQRLRDLQDDDQEAPRRLGQRLLELLRVP